MAGGIPLYSEPGWRHLHSQQYCHRDSKRHSSLRAHWIRSWSWRSFLCSEYLKVDWIFTSTWWHLRSASISASKILSRRRNILHRRHSGSRARYWKRSSSFLPPGRLLFLTRILLLVSTVPQLSSCCTLAASESSRSFVISCSDGIVQSKSLTFIKGDQKSHRTAEGRVCEQDC